MKKLVLLSLFVSGASFGMNKSVTRSGASFKPEMVALAIASIRDVRKTEEPVAENYRDCKSCREIPCSPNAPLLCTQHLKKLSRIMIERK